MTGRYAGLARVTRARADGSVDVLLVRRILPAVNDATAVGTALVGPRDRLDSIAATALGDPEAWWRIADANPVLDPAELEVPGRLLRLDAGMPLPGEAP